MIRRLGAIAAANAALIMLAAAPARAELTLCNRTSYQMEAAYGLEKRANVATRGWFRIEPGQCRQVLDGPLDATWSMSMRAHRRFMAPRPCRRGAMPISAFATAVLKL